MPTVVRNLCCVLLMAVLATACGCAKPEFVLTVDPALHGKSVTVHLVGVSQSEFQRWLDYSVTEYWRPEDLLRTAAVAGKYAAVVQFGAGRANTRTLKTKDPVWDVWNRRGGIYTFVLADIPGSFTAQQGVSDPRKLVLPLEGKYWPNLYWGKTKVPLNIERGGIICPRQHTRKDIYR